MLLDYFKISEIIQDKLLFRLIFALMVEIFITSNIKYVTKTLYKVKNRKNETLKLLP